MPKQLHTPRPWSCPYPWTQPKIPTPRLHAHAHAPSFKTNTSTSSVPIATNGQRFKQASLIFRLLCSLNRHARHCRSCTLPPNYQMQVISERCSLRCPQKDMRSLIFYFHYYRDGLMYSQYDLPLSGLEKIILSVALNRLHRSLFSMESGFTSSVRSIVLSPGFMTFGALCTLKARGRMSGIIDGWIRGPWFTVGFRPMIWLLSSNTWLPMVYKLISFFFPPDSTSSQSIYQAW